MSPVIDLMLIVGLVLAAGCWVLLYYFLVEGMLKRLVGSLFGVTIGASELRSRRVAASTRFYLSSWSVVEPSSPGCLLSAFIWVLGGALRSVFIGVPAGGLLLAALYMAYRVTRP